MPAICQRTCLPRAGEGRTDPRLTEGFDPVGSTTSTRPSRERSLMPSIRREPLVPERPKSEKVSVGRTQPTIPPAAIRASGVRVDDRVTDLIRSKLGLRGKDQDVSAFFGQHDRAGDFKPPGRLIIDNAVRCQATALEEHFDIAIGNQPGVAGNFQTVRNQRGLILRMPGKGQIDKNGNRQGKAAKHQPSSRCRRRPSAMSTAATGGLHAARIIGIWPVFPSACAKFRKKNIPKPASIA